MLTETPMGALLRIACLTMMALGVGGCGTLYLAQAARGQWQVMRERQPIEQLLSAESTSPQLRARLQEVHQARDFASQELSLPDNASYRSYADVGRPFVVWNVVAAPEFSIVPRKWCFPIAGCVAYRGYFDERKARRFADRLRSGGSDVMVGGVPAYSTLGRVADPVLNTMLRYGDTELAAIIFHELSHQVIYVAGDSAFNEAFAVTVEQTGLERWLRQRGREGELARYTIGKARQRQYIAMFMVRRAELSHLYASALAPEKMRERKQSIFRSLTADIREMEKQQGVASPYGRWMTEGLNNAHLASVATYFDCLPGFEKLLREAQGNLAVFYVRVKEVARRPRAERRSQLCTGPA